MTHKKHEDESRSEGANSSYRIEGIVTEQLADLTNERTIESAMRDDDVADVPLQSLMERWK